MARRGGERPTGRGDRRDDHGANRREGSQPAAPESDRVCVGAIAGAFGVRGEARIKPFTDDPEAIGDYGPLETEDGARRFEFRLTRMAKGFAVGFLSGLRDREEAEALRGARLYVSRGALPPPEEDEFYHADLIGMTVVDQAGETLGRVASVQNYGAGDFLEIEAPGRRRLSLMPFTRETAPEIDLAAQRITAVPPLGVFEDAPDEDEPPAEDAPEADEAPARGGPSDG